MSGVAEPGKHGASDGRVNGATKERPWLFGGPRGADPRAAGRLGGRRTQEHYRAVKALEPEALARMLATGSKLRHSPMAVRSALVYALARENEIGKARRLADARVIEADWMLEQLSDWSEQERTTLAVRSACSRRRTRGAPHTRAASATGGRAARGRPRRSSGAAGAGWRPPS
jgi:hypothetical protein